MEWVSTIVAAIVGLLSALGGGSIIYARQTRQLKEIENEAKQSEEWRKLYEEMKKEVAERERKIDNLYCEISRHRDEKVEMRKEMTRLEVKVVKLEYAKCESSYCPDRVPPTELTPKKNNKQNQ